MSPLNHLFLVFSISIMLCASVDSDSTDEKIEAISEDKITDNNLITSSDDKTSEVDVITTESGVSEEDTTQTSEDNNAVQEDEIEGDRQDVHKTDDSLIKNANMNPNYYRGDFGGYYYIGNDSTSFYCHGKFQEPMLNYYGSYQHILEDKTTLGYYLGYALNKMDRNEYFLHHNFTHFNVHHYYFKNSIMFPELDINSDNLIICAQNTSTFCPQNTEAICLLNSTVWCATKKIYVENCDETSVKGCVETRVPCVFSDDQNCKQLTEYLKLPCISTVTILDVNRDKNGLTFNNVAGTFVLAPVSPVLERTYCVTIVAEPSKDPE